MISRRIVAELLDRLDSSPAVVLLGPRQVGKTTLARSIASERRSVYLDLESDRDRAKLDDPEIYLAHHHDELVILDEVHRLPGLFQNLRGIIDEGRRAGRHVGRFLLLGSASIDLMQQSGESLAGRVSYLEMTPLDALEVETEHLDRLWLRGGFPSSYLAKSERHSLRWRRDFVRTYLERDVPMLGPRIAAETLRRLWTMLAHHQSSLLDASSFARALGVDGKTVAKYLDLLVDLLLVRRLPPWHSNVGKRLVKSPKVYLRDSGITHALLGIEGVDDLLAHPVAGGSYEGFVIESLIAAAPEGTEPSFYRTAAGAEIDLVLSPPSGRPWAIEVKRSLSPSVGKGFHLACEDLSAARKLVIHPGRESFPLAHGVEAMSLRDAAETVRAFR